MFENLPILTLITFLPLVGALMLAVFAWTGKADGREQLEKNAPRAALVLSGFVFILSVLLVLDFDSAESGYQFVHEMAWIGGGIDYRVGVDGISVLFVLLTAFLTPFCILASMTSVKKRMIEYMIAFLDPNVYYHWCLGRKEPGLRLL